MENFIIICGGSLLAALILFVFFILPGLFEKPDRPPSGTETGYYITRKSDGYPMHVNGNAYYKACLTGDYICEGLSGGRVPIGQQYKDERLN